VQADIPDLIARMESEIARQDARWGDQSRHPDQPNSGPSADAWAKLSALLEAESRASLHRGATWAAILGEEVGEAFQADAPEDRIKELVQVAAVAIQWASAIQRRGAL